MDDKGSSDVDVTHDAVADVTVRFGKETVQLSLPLCTTVSELHAALEARTCVQANKQRLLLNAPVCKEHRRCGGGDTDTRTLADLLPASLVSRLRTHDSGTAQHVALSAMLLGSATQTPHVNSKATSEVSRLVSTTIEYDNRWYRCCYGKGYLRQAAYVCRTCVNEGRADAAHALCLACAEVCHADHEMEEWGVRHCMRCDCCTVKCWKPVATSATVMADTHTDTTTTTTTTVSTSTSPPSMLVRVPQTVSSSAAATHRDDGDDDKDAQQPPQHADNTTTTTMAATTRAAAAAATGALGAPRRPLPLSNRDILCRTRRKRSRSSSPLASSRGGGGGGGSPLVGVTMTPVHSASVGVVDAHNNNKDDDGTSGSAFAAAAPTTLTLPSTQDATNTYDDKNNSEHKDTDASASSAPSHTAARSSTATSAPATTRCLFVLDSDTGKPPSNAVIPANRRNRYPRNPLAWCYCEAALPDDDPECGGIACMLCTSCFWSAHMTRLHTAQLRRVACYGDVVQGETLAFRCHTCHTLVCPPCRYRCHKDHQCDDVPVVVPQAVDRDATATAAAEEQQQQQQHEDGEEATMTTTRTTTTTTTNNNDGADTDAAAGGGGGSTLFSCGCRGLCAIAEAVPPEEVDDATTYAPVPDDVAVALMNDDVFTGFVCAHCMREYPWLMTDDPLRCYGGTLPAKVPLDEQTQRRVIACGATADVAADADADVFPYHGMLLPVNAFTAQATCRCGPCRAAFAAFAPRAEADATEMVIELHDQCDHCGVMIKDQQAFMCVTCEAKFDHTFLLCGECNALRQHLVAQQHQLHPAALPSDRATDNSNDNTADNDANNNNNGGDNNKDDDDKARPYRHDLSHEFLEDTLDNLTTLCGMQTLQSLDAESRQYLRENLHTVLHEQFSITDTISSAFGQTPIELDEDELREFALANRASTSTNMNNNNNSSSTGSGKDNATRDGGSSGSGDEKAKRDSTPTS